MDKKDRVFLTKVAKKADEAHAIAKRVEEMVKELKIESPAIETLKTVTTNKLTQTFVLFENPAELQKHSGTIMELNKNIDTLCKTIGVKELRITYNL